jgi:hypothetical protein
MLEYAVTCHVCSRLFMGNAPFAGPLPKHLDAILGSPCGASGETAVGCVKTVGASAVLPDQPWYLAR